MNNKRKVAFQGNAACGVEAQQTDAAAGNHDMDRVVESRTHYRNLVEPFSL
jgi:hypothetical protein